jgi:hypothetical protein
MAAPLHTLLAWSIDPVKWARECCDWQPDPWQGDALRARGDLDLLCSRQSGKSTTTAALCAHTALSRPGRTVIIVSPGQRQSAETFAKAVTFIRASLEAFDLRLLEDNKLSLALSNGSRIISLPASEETIRSYSAHLLVLDEAARISDDVWAAVRPMTAATGGRTVLLSTPRGGEGFFARVWHDNDPAWHRILVTADDCPRIPKAFLERERRLLGEARYGEEYLCDFRSRSNAAFSLAAIDDAFGAELGIGAPWLDEDDGYEEVIHRGPAIQQAV